MITEIEIFNFKCFKKAKLKKLSTVNLISGNNGSGKTALLESIFLYYARQRPDALETFLRWRGFNQFNRSVDDIFAPYFNDFDIKNKIAINIKNNGFSESNKLKIIFNPESKLPANLGIEQSPSLSPNSMPDGISISSSALEFKFQNNNLRKSWVTHKIFFAGNGMSAFIDSSDKIDLLGTFICDGSYNSNNLSILYSNLLEYKKEKEFTEIIKKFFEQAQISWVDFQNNVTPNGAFMSADIGLSQRLPLESISSGLTKILTILLSIYNNRNGFICIDELENGIHVSTLPLLCNTIAELCKEFNCQAFISSHSYELLSNFSQVNHEDISFHKIINTKLENEYSKKIVSYSGKILSNAIKDNLEVR